MSSVSRSAGGSGSSIRTRRGGGVEAVVASEVASRSARRTARASAVAEEHVHGGARNAARTGDERARRDGRARGRGRPRHGGQRATRRAGGGGGGARGPSIARLWRAASKWRGGDPQIAPKAQANSLRNSRTFKPRSISGLLVVGLRVDSPPPAPSALRRDVAPGARASRRRALARSVFPPRSVPSGAAAWATLVARPRGRRHLAPLRASSELAHRPRGRSPSPGLRPARRRGSPARASAWTPSAPSTPPPRPPVRRRTLSFGVGRFSAIDPARIPRASRSARAAAAPRSEEEDSEASRGSSDSSSESPRAPRPGRRPRVSRRQPGRRVRRARVAWRSASRIAPTPPSS